MIKSYSFLNLEFRIMWDHYAERAQVAEENSAGQCEKATIRFIPGILMMLLIQSQVRKYLLEE